MRSTRSGLKATAATAATLLGLTALTGCFPSGDKGPFAGQNGSQVADKSVAALRTADSLTVKGSVRDEGKAIRLDMAVSKSGDCKGTMQLEGEGSFELIRNSEYVFIKADEAFYRTQVKDMPKDQADEVLKMLAGHWVKSKNTTEDSKDLAAMCDLDELLKEFDKSAGAKKGKVVTEGGQEALTLATRISDDDIETLYVATKGTPYLLRAVETGKDPADLAFSGFNAPVKAEAPTGDVIDADE
ncbi:MULTISPECIES: hypothetical protein [unclassified Streptomyces]|uniref:hypothetical protein n=1 Tax=unclassified Streptomyces TaxID=2593676 RepID=UPI00224F50FB|nr:hypothetical protein [Streptomyces sp. NBC_01551]MCX4526217.1 hypothetical protein [Streptomyces sp. NBC_01551]